MNAGIRDDGDPVGLELLDPVSLVVHWSNGYDRGLPGMAGRDIVGHTYKDFMPIAGELGMEEKLRRVAETGEPHREVMRVMASPGHQAHTWWWAVYRIPSGELLVAYGREA